MVKIRIGLASKKSIDFELNINLTTLLNGMKEASESGCDLLVFGEAFLHGFNGLYFDYSKDVNIALKMNSELFNQIKQSCIRNQIAVSFSFFEFDDKSIFCTNIVYDKNGKIISRYRRISPGWKIENADFHYKEGSEISYFSFMGLQFAIALCGDLWIKDVYSLINKKTDIVLWPLFIDYNIKEFSQIHVYEYAEQVKELNNVLFVNSITENVSNGGAYHFHKNSIKDSLSIGEEGILYIDF